MRYGWTCLSFLVAVGCGGSQSDVKSLEVAMGAAAAIGQSAVLANSAVNATGTVTCAAASPACTSFPCTTTVTVTLGSGCPVPLGGDGTGTVTVSGTWQSADQATVTSEYTSARVGTRNLVVAQTRNYTVQRSGDTVTATYTGQNVQVRGAVALAAQSNWTVVVNTAGTPDDPSDDTYTINGTQQSAGGTSVAQLNVSSAVLSPSCRRNPTSGSATIQQVSATRIRQETVQFQSTCDGTAQLTSTTGGRSSVTLDFLE
ncbi:MAG TPA: hypothetical protein VH877_31035 [Polyangia bacterium]|jgi:hypothetical protein|nr:hypothetical protein [Polyangia bacterium]